MDSNIDLGFLTRQETWKLHSRFFPSKVGGKPAWLDLKTLPSTEEMQCSLCSQPMLFLLQIYAPIEEQSECFHRTIFIFVCDRLECACKNNNANFKVFRCQLSRFNDFYPSDPPIEKKSANFDLNTIRRICYTCGCGATKECSKCHRPYCSKLHQTIDWKIEHKHSCSASGKIATEKTSEKFLFKEYTIDMEIENVSNGDSEEDVAPDTGELNDNNKKLLTDEMFNIPENNPNNDCELKEGNDKDVDSRQLADYEKLIAEGKAGSMLDTNPEDLQAFVVPEDETFEQFKERISDYPDQILRYSRGSIPLWISSERPDEKEIPSCENCGSARQFEFQVLPQIIYELKDERLDFGTLIVYTCSKSCSNGLAYKKEFLYKQDVSD